MSPMRASIRYVLLSSLAVAGGCAISGDGTSSQAAIGGVSPVAECAPGSSCLGAPAGSPASEAPVRPVVPPVPDSPIKLDCAKLPTQVERDTCTNRKDSTG